MIASAGSVTCSQSARLSTSAIRASPLIRGGGLGIGAAGRHGREQLGDRQLGHVQLAQGRQHVLDVGEERLVRPDDEHAAAAEPLRVRVQQVRDPVQANRRLAGAGRALHAHGLLDPGADDVILVGLDRGHDVAHRARTRPLDLVDQDPAGRARVGSAAAAELLVLERGQLAAGETEPPPPLQAHRLGLAGPVERPRDRRPPVDDHGRALRVVHVPAADVEVLPGRLISVRGRAFGQLISGITARQGARQVIETAEEQRRVRQVLERLRAPVQVGFQVLLGDRVTAHRAQRQHVRAHQAEELPGLAQMVALGGQDPGAPFWGHD